MEQSATLYRIDKSDFAKIIDNPTDFGLSKITKGYEIFEKSFEGLRFVLSKGLDKPNIDLVEQIFYPKTYIGEEIDFSKLDFDNLPDDFDFERQPIYYNGPDKVVEIYNLLSTITNDIFKKNFDHNELNEQGVYSSDIWNNKAEENIAFNIRHMSLEFKNLKTIFESANENSDYILSYVG